jgi:hypothetical protein
MKTETSVMRNSMEKPNSDILDENIIGSTAALVPYGPSGFKGIFASRYVAYCAAFSAIGGMLFGYE